MFNYSLSNETGDEHKAVPPMDPERKIGARSAVFLSEAKESLSNTSPTL
jgi:hypothetical protein